MASEGASTRCLISFRVLESELDLLDCLAAKLTAADGGEVRCTRTDVLRVAIHLLAQQEVPNEFTDPCR